MKTTDPSNEEATRDPAHHQPRPLPWERNLNLQIPSVKYISLDDEQTMIIIV